RLENIAMLREIAQVIYCDENIVMRHKLNARATEAVAPVLKEILAQGAAEGSFDVFDTEEVALLVLHVSNMMAEQQTRTLLGSELTPEAISKVEKRFNLFLDILERILGAPRGSLERPHDDLIEGMCRQVAARGWKQ
ncbi:MAG: hypothetical protein ABIH46_12640, partial [Chloroflexota bacterium]